MQAAGQYLGSKSSGRIGIKRAKRLNMLLSPACCVVSTVMGKK